jgi:hypothetical protein
MKRRLVQWWRRLLVLLGHPPLIRTEWGPVSEGARRQAALNFRDDPEKRRIAIGMIGIEECKRRYPEGGWDAE